MEYETIRETFYDFLGIEQRKIIEKQQKRSNRIMKPSTSEKVKRYIIFLIGLFINSLGVSLITKANLGTSPISSIPYVLSLNFPFTLGNFTIFFSILLIVLQMLILRKNFKAEHLLQIPVSILFGYFIDFTMILLGFVHPQSYVVKVIDLLIGCLILGFGVYIEVLADVVMLPGESFVRAVVQTWNREFGSTKVVFDVSMAVIAIIMSLVLSHTVNGVREGTIIAALLVGAIARQFGKRLEFIKPMLFPANAKNTDADNVENGTGIQDVQKYVIAIGRQYGCGGSEIGKKLAEHLGYEFYDGKIIQMTAGTTGYSVDYVEKQEENMTNSLLYDLVSQIKMTENYETPKDKIYEAEAQAVRELAAKGNCVIVGRCADQVLKDQKNCLRVFLHAPLEKRVQNIMERKQLSARDAKSAILKEDRRRGINYHYYTGQNWGAAENYHISLDTELGYEYIEESIRKAL